MTRKKMETLLMLAKNATRGSRHEEDGKIVITTKNGQEIDLGHVYRNRLQSAHDIFFLLEFTPDAALDILKNLYKWRELSLGLSKELARLTGKSAHAIRREALKNARAK